jgi:TolB-like protein
VPTEGEGFDRLLRWFRQRRLIHVLAIYLGASWLILEITDVFIDKLALPAWFFPAAIVLLLIGLTVVITTAIVEGATVAAPVAEPGAHPPEVAVEPRPRSMWSRALLGAAAVAAVLVIAGSVLTLLDQDEATPVVDPSLKSLAVLPFHTSGPELELWREGLMDVLSSNLDDVADLHTIDTRTVLSRWRSRIGDREATEVEALSVAQGLGARWAISGQLVELGGQVRIDASLHSATTGETLGSASLAAVPDSIRRDSALRSVRCRPIRSRLSGRTWRANRRCAECKPTGRSKPFNVLWTPTRPSHSPHTASHTPTAGNTISGTRRR